MNKVSILIPCYNVDRFLQKCVGSITSQTYGNLQIVIIDDGSTDNTWPIMQTLASSDSRIEIYRQDNHGVAYTRNKLLSLVGGEYVLFVDSDDWLESDMVEFLLNSVVSHKADVAICGIVKNDTPVRPDYEERIMDMAETVKKFLFHKELKGSLCNKLIKTSLLHNLSFDPSIGYGEDALFCWQVFQRVNKVVLTDKELYHYRMNQTSISHNSFGKQKLSGHITWQIINEESSKWWPQYLEIAQARWGLEDMYLIRQAGQSYYTNLNDIRPLQKNVRRFIPQMKSIGLLSGKEVFNASMMSRWYGYAILYHWLNKLKRLFR